MFLVVKEKRGYKFVKFTGQGGGEQCQDDEIDTMILDIFGSDSVLVHGIGLPKSTQSSIIAEGKLIIVILFNQFYFMFIIYMKDSDDDVLFSILPYQSEMQ